MSPIAVRHVRRQHAQEAVAGHARLRRGAGCSTSRWPLYAGYDIKTSLDTPATSKRSNARVDFASVRTSLKPSVAAKVDKVVSDALRKTEWRAGRLPTSFKGR